MATFCAPLTPPKKTIETVPVYQRRVLLPAPAADVFEWHARPGALERLIPPWENIRLLERTGGIEDGARTVIQLRKGPFKFRWVAVHKDFVPGRQFVDEQVSGPFAVWCHAHRVTPAGTDEAYLEDEIAYRLPGGKLGESIAGSRVRRHLERTFRFRHCRTKDDLSRHFGHPRQPRLHVAISGASGLIGRNLSAFLTTGGHRASTLVRRPPRPGGREVQWDPYAGTLDANGIEDTDAVIHLSGRSIAGWRWTESVKREIRDSRVKTTRFLAESLARLERPPKTLIVASAVGYYGNRGDEAVDEASPPGTGFLPELCREWEAATEPARAAGIRVVNLRVGLVLTAGGGVLSRLLLPFRLGLGGVLGSGRQHMSWIALDDLLGAILHLIHAKDLDGPVNVVSPQPLTNREFTRTLGTVLRRPTVVPVPALALKAMFGEMGRVLFLDGARVEPRRLQAESGFRYLYPTLESALQHELGLLEQ